MKHVKLLTIVALVLVYSLSVFAAVDAGSANANSLENIKLKTPRPYVAAKHDVKATNTKGTDIVMSWLADYNLPIASNFGGWTHDYFFEYFVPSADGTLNSIDFNFSDLPEATGGKLNVWIYKANYAWPEINTGNAANNQCTLGSLGYYNNPTGYEVAPPYDATDPDANWVKGAINSAPGAYPDKKYDPMGEQLWPTFGAGALDMVPTAEDDGATVPNIIVNFDLNAAAGESFNFTRGDTFVVVARIVGFENDGDGADYRAGFWSGSITMPNEVEQPCAKFYSDISGFNTNCNPAGIGWYVRTYVWDWRLNATLTGDRGPEFVSMTSLATTLSTGAQTVSVNVTDDNPGGGAAGVAGVDLFYSIDGGDYVSVAMTGSGENFSGEIPGQQPGTDITYYAVATDVGGLPTTSSVNTYSIFAATAPILLVYDYSTLSSAYAWYYMYATADTFQNNYDIWDGAYGPVTNQLLWNYEMVIHIMGDGPDNQPDNIGEVYKTWLSGGTAANPRRLLISGQDYGYISGFADTTFAAGSFEYDYLGIETLGPQDVNYDGSVASYQTPYAVNAVTGTLTGDLIDFCGDSLQMFYNPAFEIGANNWIDNLTPTSSATVCFTDPNNGDAACGVYNGTDAWKTAFWALDYLSLDYYDPADTTSKYYWALTDVCNPIEATLEWFGAPTMVVTDVKSIENASAYRLNANYPNPFNPTTTLSFSIPSHELVSLTIYNMLGQEITTLVNSTLDAGDHSYVWNGRDAAGNIVSSGVYFYTMKAGNYTSTQKMVFMK